MSQITRCPDCGTMFRVVPDQLRISQGWVRCGQCAEIFDASDNLQPEAAAGAAPGAPAPDAQPERSSSEEGGDTEAFASSLNTEFGDGPPPEPLDSAQLDAQALALAEHPLDRPFELRREDIAQAGDERLDAQPSRPRIEPRPRPKPELEPEPELHDLAFVRQARRKAFWRRPVVRAAMLVLLVILGLLLVMQISVHERDGLAARNPALRPLLAKLCAPVNCSIRPPRQIDAISIESSSFNKMRSDAFRLNLTLKNQATMEVAMPALELTLTDAQDQPVMRRVLMPAEIGSGPAAIAATSEWSGSLALDLAEGEGSRIAGYRLLAFYP